MLKKMVSELLNNKMVELLSDENLLVNKCEICGDESSIYENLDCGCNSAHNKVYEKCVVCDELFNENDGLQTGVCCENCRENMIETVRDDLIYEYDLDIECEDVEILDDEYITALYINFKKTTK